MEKQLSKFFILELFSVCLKRISVLEIAIEHVQYHYLPSQEYKKVWKSIVTNYQLSKTLISLGTLSQQYITDRDVLEILNKISTIDTPSETVIVEQLELFIKKMIFIDTHRELADRYNKQDEDGAYKLLSDAAEKISEFTLSKKAYFHNIVEGIEDRLAERREATMSGSTAVRAPSSKIPTGIQLELDSQLKGGIDRGDTMLWMAISGGGKSKAMKYSGYYNSKIGNRVVHIQGEGTLQEALQQYDAAFIGASVDVVESGLLNIETQKDLSSVVNHIRERGGEIHLKAFEQFGSVSLSDVRAFCYDVVKAYGPIDLLILDYLELFNPGDGKHHKEERMRREATANQFKNLCMELNCAGISATQAMDVPHQMRNDAKFVLKREHISEFKGMVKPFSVFATINATDDEIKTGIKRIHIDKFRKYYLPVPTFPVVINFENERFYDGVETHKLLSYGRTDVHTSQGS